MLERWSRISPGLALAFGIGSGCRQPPAPDRQTPPEPERSAVAALRQAHPESSRPPGEAPARLDPSDLVLPPEHPYQRIAFSRYRLAFLDGDVLVVRRLRDLGVATRFRVPDARNVVALVGGGFIAAGRDHVHRLSGIERRSERFPRVPRLGPTTVIASTQDSRQFWMHYEGIPRLSQFMLGHAIEPSTSSVLSFTDLVGFDHRALLGEGDGAVIYTVAEGLRRLTADGRRDDLPAPELAGTVWRLARSWRRDRVWAATRDHAYLVTARERAEVVERIVLPPRALALDGHREQLAVLALERLDPDGAQLRLEVYVRGKGPRAVLRWRDPRPRGADAGAPPALLPEVRLSPRGDWVAAAGYGLSVWNWRDQTRLPLPVEAARNLAPTSR